MTSREPTIMYTKFTKKYNLTDKEFNLIVSSNSKPIQNQKCSICLDIIQQNSCRLVCGHSYHKYCIKPWLMRHSLDCPYCRRSVLLDLEHGIFHSYVQEGVYPDGCKWTICYLFYVWNGIYVCLYGGKL